MEPPFETADPILAAAIISSTGATLLGIDRTDPKRLIYIFAGDSVPDGFVTLFKQGDLRVDPIMFCLAQMFLKQKDERGWKGSVM